jgi:hypothetical protein
VRNKLDEYIRGLPQFGPLTPEQLKAQEAAQAQLRERATLIESTVVTAQMRGRHSIKVSSKHARLRQYSWEVAKKIEASPTLPYVTLNIDTIRPEMELGIFSYLGLFPTESIGRSETCTFDCDEGDLDDLIQGLQDAKTALNRAVKGMTNA